MLTLRIKTGNDAISTPPSIADALREVADQLDNDCLSGTIFDRNGNTVGHFAARGL